jgi:hypothetical protein
MAGLLIVLGALAAVVLLAIEFLAHLSLGFSCPGWVGWLGALIVAVIVAIDLVHGWRARP